jgi:hypothetical protein
MPFIFVREGLFFIKQKYEERSRSFPEVRNFHVILVLRGSNVM